MYSKFSITTHRKPKVVQKQWWLGKRNLFILNFGMKLVFQSSNIKTVWNYKLLYIGVEFVLKTLAPFFPNHLPTWSSPKTTWEPQAATYKVGSPAKDTVSTEAIISLRNRIIAETTYPVQKGSGQITTLLETNIAPENGWLEYKFPFWDGPVSGAMLVLGRVFRRKCQNQLCFWKIYRNTNACLWPTEVMKRMLFREFSDEELLVG